MNNLNLKYLIRNIKLESCFRLYVDLITFIFVIPYFLFLIFFNSLDSFLLTKIALSGEVPIAVGREEDSL